MADTIDQARMVPGSPGRVPGAECRINGLLLRVISFLHARQAVQTCVLSRRWRDLWRSVPRINATRHEFDGMADTEEERDVLFKKFINAFLMLRNPVPLDEFRLSSYFMPVDPDADSEDANLWLLHALQSNAWSVEVEIWGDRLYLDPAVFASECVLTCLQLSGVILFHGFFRILQTQCTALERLLLSDCFIDDVEISSQTLKVLTIDCLSNFMSDEQPSISIPSLRHIGFSVSTSIPLLKDMGSLVTASVSVGSGGTQVGDIPQLLRSLSGVTNLGFKGGLMKIEKNSQWCPKFNNLTALTLGYWCLPAHYFALKVFLQNCPNLVKLTLKLKQCDYTSDETIIDELEQGSFTRQHIEMLEIECSDGDRNVLEKLLVKGGITYGQVRFRH